MGAEADPGISIELRHKIAENGLFWGGGCGHREAVGFLSFTELLLLVLSLLLLLLLILSSLFFFVSQHLHGRDWIVYIFEEETIEFLDWFEGNKLVVDWNANISSDYNVAISLILTVNWIFYASINKNVTVNHSASEIPTLPIYSIVPGIKTVWNTCNIGGWTS